MKFCYWFTLFTALLLSACSIDGTSSVEISDSTSKYDRRTSSAILTDERIETNATIELNNHTDINNKAHFALIRRPLYDGTHSGEIAFPGGKHEGEEQLVQTALRETFEEVGVDAGEVEIIKQFSNVYIPPSNFLATPFMGYLNHMPSFTVNHEVASTINVLVSDLLSELNLSSTNLSTSYSKNIEVPCFVLNDYIVWGATAMMLGEIRDLLLKI